MRERLFLGVVYVLLIGFALICFIPFWIVLINSFADESVIQTSGYQLFPTSFSLDAYTFLLSGEQVFRSYGVTLFVTIAGTMLGVTLTATYAYVLSHPKVKYRHVLSFLTFLTMLFGAGLVGFYMLIANWLHLKDSLWALILPYLLNPFYAFILVSYYRSLPYEMNEAATVDGANDIHIFFRVIWPVSLPVIATVALFYALQYWNDWYLSLLFIDNYKMHPLQIMIRQLMSNLNAMSYVGGSQTDYNIMIPTYGMQLAIVCITIGPIVLVYPFVQKYFIKGMTLGSVKG
ncbi:carbohydrate ABC transporter membrane protein 2, CUT1 family (TC 3.A.1.1.-) [Paenibacillus uliginis N3/975]|uniref:Carbohydrate ABC transporter membrane protein 2, CUT1 family (TC 3.A.1.1.-) n=1 Tax=Paenibacillus uliginis N3/975 TaxID=1313296 RepID=A0A1X7HSS0_9BACL|nr:carbohydrate ABC transporter permease [Paenibacillus uliginis]SMF92044.1 carbohydrate ABC transporter membrane protein 2, CUT1 family (TC 3.A.1.1.-) [Paenibacillus uliginis N3/975]